MNNTQLEKMGDFLKYIHCNNITVLCSDYKPEQAESVVEFVTILKEKAGEEFSCVLDRSNNKIMFFDDYCKEYVGYIYGTVEYGFWRGDIHNSKLFIQYAVIENNVYIGGERVAYIDSPEQIKVTRDGIYIIDKRTKSLMKYTDYKQQWKTEIPVNYTQTYQLRPHLDYLGDPYPKGLIVIEGTSELYHFYRENGAFYGHTRVNKQYELI